MGPCRPVLKIQGRGGWQQQRSVGSGISGCGNKRVAGIVPCSAAYVRLLYGQTWHGQQGRCVSSAMSLHFSEDLKHLPPNPTHAAAAFANSDGGLEDHGQACGQGGDAGREGGSGVGHCSRGHRQWLWQAGSTWRNDRRHPPDKRQRPDDRWGRQH